jgi:hypothetical protein
MVSIFYSRRVWGYQKDNYNPYLEEEQTAQWRKEKVQKDKQRSTKHTHETKDRITRTPLKTGGELTCSRRVGSSCSTSGTRRVNLVSNPVISHKWGKNREMFTTSDTLKWLSVTPENGSEWSCIYVLGISIFAPFCDFNIRFWNCSASMVFFVFYFIMSLFPNVKERIFWIYAK